MEKEELEQKEIQEQNAKQKQAEAAQLITDLAESEKERERRRKMERIEAAKKAKKRKLIPPFVMLLAGAVTSITMYALHYNTKDMLIILLCVLVVFFVIGDLVKWMLDRFEAQIEQKRIEEGEVIEKELDEDDGTQKSDEEEEREE